MRAPVEVGLGIQSDKPAEHYIQLAEAAEAAGFDVLSVYNDLGFQPAIYPLLEMARVTSRVRLGAACWNPYTVHPYELAGQLIALDHSSQGRCYLGLARGTWLKAIGVRQTRPITHLREAIQVIVALATGDETGVDGEVFRLAPGMRLRYDLPARRPPLLIGTWGSKTAALAGELADEVKVGGTANPAMINVMKNRVAPGCASVGRSEDGVAVVVGAVSVVDENGDAARARARIEVAMYLAVVADFDPTVQLPDDLLQTINKHVEDGDYESAGRYIPDDVLDLFAFSGTPERIAEQAQSLIDAGASRIEFGTPHGLTGLNGIKQLGERVLPILDRS